MTDKDKEMREDYEKWFAGQLVHNPDLYKWGALWICWQDAYQAGLSARVPDCTWSEDDEGNWVTTCGCNVSLSPKEYMKFCCCCGGVLVMKGEE